MLTLFSSLARPNKPHAKFPARVSKDSQITRQRTNIHARDELVPIGQIAQPDGSPQEVFTVISNPWQPQTRRSCMSWMHIQSLTRQRGERLRERRLVCLVYR